MLYFAYGSNLLLARLRQADRAPSAQAVVRAWLEGHALRFHKRGQDGSGKCDAFSTGRGADVVHGALFRLAPEDKAALDAAEGLGRGYTERSTRVATPEGPQAAFFYQAEEAYVDPSLLPFGWYRDLVVAGAMERRLPGPYVAQLAAVTAVTDPDRERASRQRRALP